MHYHTVERKDAAVADDGVGRACVVGVDSRIVNPAVAKPEGAFFCRTNGILETNILCVVLARTEDIFAGADGGSSTNWYVISKRTFLLTGEKPVSMHCVPEDSMYSTTLMRLDGVAAQAEETANAQRRKRMRFMVLRSE